MSTIFPRSAVSAARPPAPLVSRDTHEAARVAVRALLEESASFRRLSPEKRAALAQGLVQIGGFLAEPGEKLKPDQHIPQVRALAGEGTSRIRQSGTNTDAEGKFTAQGAREGAAAAGALMDAVNFPEFCAGLINGVFHSIVQSSLEQMEAYGKLVADVSKSLNQFRDDNTTQNQGRDHLVEQFPDMFQLTMSSDDPFGGSGGGFGGGAGDDFGGGFGSGFGDRPAPPPSPRVSLREGVDEAAAIERLNRALPLERPLERLDDELVEALLVPAARTQIATGRQQLLATMVMLGINRIVVTDGKISAKVMYDFQARDNMQFRKSAQNYDYSDHTIDTESVSNGSIQRSGPTRNLTRMPDGRLIETHRDASFYTKGDYKSTSQPMIRMQSASQTTADANLTTKATLAGTMEVRFKSDYLPLEKLANPESIAAIQMNAQPGMVKTLAGRPAAPSNAPPAPTATPAAPVIPAPTV